MFKEKMLQTIESSLRAPRQFNKKQTHTTAQNTQIKT